jgi:hypothetical protein
MWSGLLLSCGYPSLYLADYKLNAYNKQNNFSEEKRFFENSYSATKQKETSKPLSKITNLNINDCKLIPLIGHASDIVSVVCCSKCFFIYYLFFFLFVYKLILFSYFSSLVSNHYSHIFTSQTQLLFQHTSTLASSKSSKIITASECMISIDADGNFFSWPLPLSSRTNSKQSLKKLLIESTKFIEFCASVAVKSAEIEFLSLKNQKNKEEFNITDRIFKLMRPITIEDLNPLVVLRVCYLFT